MFLSQTKRIVSLEDRNAQREQFKEKKSNRIDKQTTLHNFPNDLAESFVHGHNDEKAKLKLEAILEGAFDIPEQMKIDVFNKEIIEDAPSPTIVDFRLFQQVEPISLVYRPDAFIVIERCYDYTSDEEQQLKYKCTQATITFEDILRSSKIPYDQTKWARRLIRVSCSDSTSKPSSGKQPPVVVRRKRPSKAKKVIEQKIKKGEIRRRPPLGKWAQPKWKSLLSNRNHAPSKAKSPFFTL